jgi:fructose/tagatose bisphosphate aldolase
MIVTTAQLYKVAYGKFAVGAYNINNMEQLLGLFWRQRQKPRAVHYPALEGR